jgi:hypothetical protein
VVHFGQHRPAAVGESFDHPAFPERPVAVEALRHDPGDEAAERRVVAGRGQGGSPDVVLEVEPAVVDPDRMAEVQR